MKALPSLRRGQTLLMFVMTLMLLALMVLVTLGIATRAREKIELQMIADASAYSNAVATARVLNGIAVLNRAEVAHMVSLATAQSLISYSSLYRAALNGLDIELEEALQRGWCFGGGDNCHNDACDKMQRVLNNLRNNEQPRFTAPGTPTRWDDLDREAGEHARTIQSQSSNIWGYGLLFSTYQSRLWTQLHPRYLNNQAIANQIANAASTGSFWPGEISAPAAADVVSLRETNSANCGPETTNCDVNTSEYVLSPREKTREIGVKAAMGSRGHTFLVDRGGSSDDVIERQLRRRLDPGGNLDATFDMDFEGGSGRFGAAPKDRHTRVTPAPEGAIGEDHGTIRASTFSTANPGGPCSRRTRTANISAWVYSSDSTESHDDEHTWEPHLFAPPNPPFPPVQISAEDSGMDVAPGLPLHRHTLGSCTKCPGIWTMFLDLNPERVNHDNVGSHLNGQPKNHAFLVRDYGARPAVQADPWNLFFNFRFFTGGSGSTFDNTGRTVRPASGPNIDISRQTALATGIAYYHRRGHWKEPPNLFNPFWRATLVRATIDSEGDPDTGTDIQDTISLGGGSPEAAAIVNELNNVGYRGWH